jgi:hypothetical protein
MEIERLILDGGQKTKTGKDCERVIKLRMRFGVHAKE